MRDTLGDTRVTLTVENEGRNDIVRVFDIKEIAQTDNLWALVDDEKVPRLTLTREEFTSSYSAMSSVTLARSIASGLREPGWLRLDPARH